jgi:CheY-like chemotaxis protein
MHRAVGLVTFSVVNEVLVGDIRTSGGRIFSIRYIAPTISLIEELDPARFPPEEAVLQVGVYPVADDGETPPGDTSEPDRSASDIAREAAADLTGLARERATVRQPEIIYREQPSAVLAPALPEPAVQYVTKSDTDPAASGTTNIDIVVAYTPAAATFQNHPDGILGKIREAVFHANESYRTGDVRQRITLVHSQQVDYLEKGSDWADLQELDHNMPRSTFRTVLDGLRSQHQADIVVLVTKEVQAQESCGRANQLQSLSSGFCNRAFAVVPVTCATSVYSFAHELGHLMGADHNKDGVRSGPPFEHSCGYVSPDNKWRTIMSTTTRTCSAATCVRILEWSRPSQYSGVRPAPLCSDRGQKPASESPDNALALNKTSAIVAKFSDACPTGTE